MSTTNESALQQTVIAIVAEALGSEPQDVKLHSSLIDDLGAESIDFIDIVFRLESEYNLLIPEQELWAGSMEIDAGDPAAIERGIAALREKMPDFAWDRFPDGVKKSDLPRLITVQTIVDYLRKTIANPAGAS
jgi:acyl carrier protein